MARENGENGENCEQAESNDVIMGMTMCSMEDLTDSHVYLIVFNF